ncbi:ABC transporter ATP-binding protein [Rhodococcus sp. HNM0563]|uniref:ATP-binding cassette domain-containing protein n=1 Tax=unclassified Rhodococcus (in: high G+C Gram-positive bacteria) TaxID=192944 RepID=UPI00146AA115|nr:ABC transporter ATP-binding protein [Rhodococcus sp. F64268]MCK0092344.1 ABC transporter ATP-binding protein [Rhodococcus sp. F64268]NLU63090.1 ABC transporter ATP-binding protein [Rhodococcus sp. HNM0563]
MQLQTLSRTDSADTARLELAGIGVRFGGIVALDDVSLQVPAGSVVGIMGPNGAGKTTLFNVICGFIRPGDGTMSLDGKPFTPVPHRLAARGVSRTLQGLGLFAGLTAVENVAAGASGRHRSPFVAGMLGLPPAAHRNRQAVADASNLLDELGIGSYAHTLPPALPYPVAKKVAIARALISDPTLLLLDEPAGGLDQTDIDDLRELIRALPQRADSVVSVMLVEHNVDLIMSVCDHIAVLDFGRVISQGTPDEIKADPVVAQAYLGDREAS